MNALIIWEDGRDHVSTQLFFVSNIQNEGIALLKRCNQAFLNGAGNSIDLNDDLFLLKQQLFQNKKEKLVKQFSENWQCQKLNKKSICTIEQSDVPVIVIISGDAL